MLFSRVKRGRSAERHESDCGEDDEQHSDGDVPEDMEGFDGLQPSGRKSRRVEHFFSKGAIKQVKVHDFMTYNGTVTIRPGPRLNLVLGPNGTGKSSFVCALCIGLGGAPKTLGRADDLKDFVRTGAHAFWTEITLSSGGEGRDYVVRRTLTVRSERDAGGENRRHESKWAINGREVPAREVDKLVKALNIQFDNLCQFLPQDKVAEFARMDKYELLDATQKALGDSTLYDQHQRLIQLRKDEKQALADRTTAANRLAKLEADHERQRHDFERFQQREKLLQEVRSLRCQAKWLEVHAKAKAAETAKKWLEKKRAELAALEAQQEEDTRPIKARVDLIARLKNQRVAAQRKARDQDGRVLRLCAQLGQHDQAVVSLTDEMSTLEELAKKRAADIADARHKLATAQDQLAHAPEKPPQALQDRISELRGLILTSKREASELEARQNELMGQDQALQVEEGRILGQLDTLNSRKYQTLQNLGRFPGNRNIYQLHQWIEQHRTDGTFQGPVLGPLALEVSVKAVPGVPYNVALQYVESSCWKQLPSYLVSCAEDEKRLTDQLRAMQVGHEVKAVAATGDWNTPVEMAYPSGHASQHGRYGIMHTVDELIEASPPVMRFLARMCHVSSVYIGDSHAAGMMETIARETTINTLLVGGSKLAVFRSRYSDNRAIEEKELYPARLLGSYSSSEEDAEQAALMHRQQELEQQRQQLHGALEEVRQELEQHQQHQKDWCVEGHGIKHQMDAATQRRVRLMTDVKNAERHLAYKEAVRDPELRRPQLRQEIENRVAQHMQLCRELMVDIREAWSLLQVVNTVELSIQEAEVQLHALKDCRKLREDALSAARNEVSGADKSFRGYQEQFKRARDQANERFAPDDSDKDEIRRHGEAGTAPAVLVGQADEKELEAEQVVCNNQNVAAEYQRRQMEISSLTETVKNHEADVARLQKDITDLKNLWLPEIKKMVETINSSFSNNFKEIGYAGQVRLHEDEDFDKYAIEILVQFRAYEDMQLLTANRQSGGERSVSTILYLIALQGVTDTPFRVVDEINQGMDPINERKVFRQLVIASAEEHTPQCFMLTPKLLDGLEYPDNIQVLNICSGSNIAGVVEGFKMGVGYNHGISFHGMAAQSVLQELYGEA